MQANKYFLMLFIFAVILNFNNTSHAERNLLSPPPILSFKAAAYLDKEYRKTLDELKEMFIKEEDNASLENIKKLLETIKKDKAKKIVEELFIEVIKYEKKDTQFYKEIRTKLKNIESKIKDGSFNGHQKEVDFSVDKEKREYVFAWIDDGREVIKRKSFLPEMKLIIKADYHTIKKNNTAVTEYQYWVENQQESKASFIQLYLENKLPKSYILEKIEKKYGKMSFYVKISNTIDQSISYPGGYLNYFIFNNFYRKEGMPISYLPGNQMDYPFALREIEGSLPGIIECYVPVSKTGFNPQVLVSAEADEESIIGDILTTKPDTRTKHMYRGSTIGPVPLPEPFDKTKFIELIIAYNNQSINEGWNDRPEVIKFSKEGLEKIKDDLNDKAQIENYLNKLDTYYKNKMILPEGYILLKYNLDYLLSRI